MNKYCCELEEMLDSKNHYLFEGLRTCQKCTKTIVAEWDEKLEMELVLFVCG